MEYTLMCLPPDVDCDSWIPSRFYDYIGNKTRIICLAPRDSEVVTLLEQYGNSLCLFYDDSEDKNLLLLKEFFTRQDGGQMMISDEFLDRFSRENLARRLASVFNESLER